jgi:hypothetical protein
VTKQKGVIKLICIKLVVTNVGLVHRLTLGINIGIKNLTILISTILGTHPILLHPWYVFWKTPFKIIPI